jgi:hypothetical protein
MAHIRVPRSERADNGAIMEENTSEKRLAKRRAFLKRAGIAAATAPAAALMLSVQAKAQVEDPYEPPPT